MSLAGRRVLIVEDEPLIALDLQHILEETGAYVHVVFTLPDAIACLDQSWCAAIVDHHLGRETSEPIYEALHQRAVPFVVFTAAPVCEIPVTVLVVPKPASMQRILGLVAAIVKTPESSTSPALPQR